MRKHFSKVMALVLALIMSVSMASVVFADEGPGDGTNTRTPGVVNFDKDLIMPVHATVPNVSFTFDLAANTNYAGKTVGGFEVHAGIFNTKDVTNPEYKGEEETPEVSPTLPGTPVPQTYTVTFTTTHPTTKGREGNTVTSNTSEKYATESFTITFTDVDFPEPGIYRYKVTEKLPEADAKVAGVTYTAAGEQHGEEDAKVTTYYIDIYVEYKDDGSLGIGDVIVTDHDSLNPDPDKEPSEDDEPVLPKFDDEDNEKIDATDPGDDEDDDDDGDPDPNPDDKVPGEEPEDPKDNPGTNKGLSQADFYNHYDPLTLTLDKTVVGNQGSHEDYFEFTLKFTKLPKGVYYITDATSADDTIIGYVSVHEDNAETTAKVYLKHLDKISILLPSGYTYAIVENDTGVEGSKAEKTDATEYKTTVNNEASKTWSDEAWNSEDNAKLLTKSAASAADTTVTANVAVSYVNYKGGIIPTGVLLAIAPFAVLMGVGVVGGAVVLGKKR